MPDVVRLRYLGTHTVTVAVLGREVEPDCLLDFAGKLVDEQDDCYVIESGNPPETRAWPKTSWRDETTVAKPDEE
jgi:hypothetical protein